MFGIVCGFVFRMIFRCFVSLEELPLFLCSLFFFLRLLLSAESTGYGTVRMRTTQSTGKYVVLSGASHTIGIPYSVKTDKDIPF